MTSSSTLMHAAGCAEILIGLESPTAAGVEGVETRRNWKRSRFDTYAEAIERIQGHGIAVNGCFVLGLDGDGPEVFDEVEAFVRRTGQFDVQITVMTPFPGTPLYDRLLAEGRLLEPTAWERCSLFDVNFRPHAHDARSSCSRARSDWRAASTRRKNARHDGGGSTASVVATSARSTRQERLGCRHDRHRSPPRAARVANRCSWSRRCTTSPWGSRSCSCGSPSSSGWAWPPRRTSRTSTCSRCSSRSRGSATRSWPPIRSATWASSRSA